MGKPHPDRANRVIGVALALMLAVTMLPAAGLQAAYADEPAERPATSGGDVALESTNGEAAEAAAPQAPVAEEREGGMLAAGGLTYTVADGGLSLAGFDGTAPEGALAVPAAVMVDGKETSVVAVDVAEGQVADEVVVLSLPQGIKSIDTGSLAAAFPNLLSVEAAAAAGSSLPVASGAASMRAAYSTSGGMLFRPASVAVQTENGLVESIECKELVWAPPALVSARIPVECRAIAEGAFANVRNLKTVVAFGTMERIADGAFSVEQMESAKVVVPQASAAVTDAERVSASMALMGDAGQKERRSAWHEAGWRTDDIVMGKPYGSLTEAVAVTDEGQIERDELQLVSYPGAHENAMDIKKPNAEGIVEQAESGLAFTVKSDMTASVTWQGDRTATPSHLDIPSSVVIDGVTYPVTEIAAGAFEGAAFLASVAIPEGVIAIGQDAFKDCPNLAEPKLPSTVKGLIESISTEALTPLTPSEESETSRPTLSHETARSLDAESNEKASVSSVDGLQFAAGSNESVQAYSAASGIYLNIELYPRGLAEGIQIRNDNGISIGTRDRDGFTLRTADLSSPLEWSVSVGYYNDVYSSLKVVAKSSSGALYSADFIPLNTMSRFVSADMRADLHFNSATQLEAVAVLVQAPATKNTPALLTTNSLEGTGSAAKAARSDHDHDSRYYTQTALNNLFGPDVGTSNTVTDMYRRNSSRLDNVQNQLNQVEESVIGINTSFGTISYAGLDGSDMSVYPTSYRKGGTPSLPKPTKPGSEFLGWTWAGQGAPTTDANTIKGAFADGNKTVTLTANWGAPGTNYFFTSSMPCEADSGEQMHTIVVRLAAEKKALSGVTFSKKDDSPLGSNADGICFRVQGSAAVGWEQDAGPVELVDLGDGAWGVHVTVTVPAGAIDASQVVSSYADASYVAAFAKMSYTFA